MPVDVLIGLQWGDEGKGKLVDYLSEGYAAVARFQGGANAGHTIIIGEKKFVLHQLPSGVFRDDTICIIGNGVVLNPVILKQEVDQLLANGIDVRDRLVISDRCQLLTPSHRLLDAAAEAALGEQKIGSTLRGIGPAYQEKAARLGLRAGDVLLPDFGERIDRVFTRHQALLNHADLSEAKAEFLEAVTFLQTLRIESTELMIHSLLKAGKRILAEGAQGSLLDIDFGAYPFVTSSNTIAGGVCTGLGVPPRAIGQVIGVLKAYATRVGSGPFPTELNDDLGEKIRQAGREFGAATGRPRRTGWLDLPALRYAMLLSGVTSLVITKADVLSDIGQIQVCTHYQYGQTTVELPCYTAGQPQPVYQTLPGWQLSPNAQTLAELPKPLLNFIVFITKQTGVPVQYVSIGPERNQLIDLDYNL